jgi:hypothetical protein
MKVRPRARHARRKRNRPPHPQYKCSQALLASCDHHDTIVVLMCSNEIEPMDIRGFLDRVVRSSQIITTWTGTSRVTGRGSSVSHHFQISRSHEAW